LISDFPVLDFLRLRLTGRGKTETKNQWESAFAFVFGVQIHWLLTARCSLPKEVEDGK